MTPRGLLPNMPQGQHVHLDTLSTPAHVQFSFKRASIPEASSLQPNVSKRHEVELTTLVAVPTIPRLDASLRHFSLFSPSDRAEAGYMSSVSDLPRACPAGWGVARLIYE
jgi:hypothetical protein